MKYFTIVFFSTIFYLIPILNPHLLYILTSSWVFVSCVLLLDLGCLFTYMDILSRQFFQPSTSSGPRNQTIISIAKPFLCHSPQCYHCLLFLSSLPPSFPIALSLKQVSNLPCFSLCLVIKHKAFHLFLYLLFFYKSGHSSFVQISNYRQIKFRLFTYTKDVKKLACFI